MPEVFTPVPRITVTQLLDRYDGFLLDAYGVLVHGEGVLPHATEFIAEVRRRDHDFVIITNDASALPENLSLIYARQGLFIPADRFVTAGSLLAGAFEAEGLIGSNVTVLGTPDSHEYVRRAGGVLVPPGEDLDALVVGDRSGYALVPAIDAVVTAILRARDAGREVRLVLPNPDVIHPKRDGTFGISSGSIAAMVESALKSRIPEGPSSTFLHLGKPGPLLFEAGRRRLSGKRYLMIGDQLETDVRGAVAAGLESALIGTGVANLDDPFGELRPSWLLPDLSL